MKIITLLNSLLTVLVLSTMLLIAQTPPPAEQPNQASAPKKPQPTTQDARRITQLIQQLGDDNWQKRELAQQELTKIGEPALPILERTKEETDDSEIKLRLNLVIEAISDQIIKNEFPDGVILIAELTAIDGIRIGDRQGNTFGFRIVRFLKRDVKTTKEIENESLRETLGFSKGNRLEYSKIYNELSPDFAYQKCTWTRLRNYLQLNKKYLIIIPSISQIGPTGTTRRDGQVIPLFGSINDDRGLIILDHSVAAIKRITQYPQRQIKEWVGQLAGKDAFEKELLTKKIIEIDRLAERLLEQELANTDTGLQLEVALILAELGNTKAVDVLSKSLDSEHPFLRYRAICGLGKIKGWSLTVVEKLVTLLDDDRPYAEKGIGLNYRLSTASFETLAQITGNDFGKDTEKWRQWFEQQQSGYDKKSRESGGKTR